MNRALKIAMLIGMGLFLQRGFSQPFGAIPSQYYPSFTGSVNDPRVSADLFYRTAKDHDFFGLNMAYDQIIPALRSGFGINAFTHRYSFMSHLGDSTFSQNFHTSGLSLAIAPKFSRTEKLSLRGKYTFSPSIGISYSNMRNQVELNADTTNIFKNNGEQNHLTGRLGLLFNTSKYYIGYTMELINLQHEFERITIIRHFGSHLHAGYVFQKNPDSKFSMTSEMAISIQDFKKIYFPVYGLRFRYNSVLWGIIGSNRIPSIQLGWQNKTVRILTSHNFNRRKYSGQYYYSGGLAFRYIFNQKNGNGMIMY